MVLNKIRMVMFGILYVHMDFLNSIRELGIFGMSEFS